MTTSAEELVTPEYIGDLRDELHQMAVAREEWQRLVETRPTLTAEQTRAIAKAAFLIREADEAARFAIWNNYHLQILEGFSPLIDLEEAAAYEPHVDWESTLKSPRFLERSQPVALRFPGGRLEGEKLTTRRALTPTEYKDFYERWDLETYFRVLAEIRSRRICANCLAPLPKDADSRRVYCGERCRIANKQRKFRTANPMRDMEHRRKYYSSLPEIRDTPT
jgi:hypothetical protein